MGWKLVPRCHVSIIYTFLGIFVVCQGMISNAVTITTVFPVCFDNGLFGPFPEKRDYAFVVHANTSFDFL